MPRFGDEREVEREAGGEAGRVSRSVKAGGAVDVVVSPIA